MSLFMLLFEFAYHTICIVAVVSVYIVYHCMLFCRPGTRNSLLFLNAKPNSNSTKNCMSNGFRCGKIVGFRQNSNSNLNSVTPLVSVAGCLLLY